MKKLLLLLVLFVGCANDPPKIKSTLYDVRFSRYPDRIIDNEVVLINETDDHYVVQYIDWPYRKAVYEKSMYTLILKTPKMDINCENN